MKTNQFWRYNHVKGGYIRRDEFSVKSIPHRDEQDTAFEVVSCLVDHLNHLGLEVFVAVSYPHFVSNSS